MSQNSYSFTEHHSKSFQREYNETAQGCVLLKEVLTAQAIEPEDLDVTDGSSSTTPYHEWFFITQMKDIS